MRYAVCVRYTPYLSSPYLTPLLSNKLYYRNEEGVAGGVGRKVSLQYLTVRTNLLQK